MEELIENVSEDLGLPSLSINQVMFTPLVFIYLYIFNIDI